MKEVDLSEAIPATAQPVKRRVKTTESHVESHLVSRMLRLGGECFKFGIDGKRGMPDRICFFPGGDVWFVELKRDNSCKLTTRQQRFFDKMRRLGMKKAVVLKGKKDVEKWLLERGYR